MNLNFLEGMGEHLREVTRPPLLPSLQYTHSLASSGTTASGNRAAITRTNHNYIIPWFYRCVVQGQRGECRFEARFWSVLGLLNIKRIHHQFTSVAGTAETILKWQG